MAATAQGSKLRRAGRVWIAVPVGSARYFCMAIARFADVAQAGFGTRIADRLRRAGGELAEGAEMARKGRRLGSYEMATKLLSG